MKSSTIILSDKNYNDILCNVEPTLLGFMIVEAVRVIINRLVKPEDDDAQLFDTSVQYLVSITQELEAQSGESPNEEEYDEQHVYLQTCIEDRLNQLITEINMANHISFLYSFSQKLYDGMGNVNYPSVVSNYFGNKAILLLQ